MFAELLRQRSLKRLKYKRKLCVITEINSVG